MTAAAWDFSNRSSASTRCRSLRIRPSMLTRAIEPDEVKVPRLPGDIITPTPAIAATAITTAATRQKVSLRRIRRRSTITSESIDIEILLKYGPRFASTARTTRYPITSIAAQFEEMKACGAHERQRKRPRSQPRPDWFGEGSLLVGAVLERGAENVAQRRARIGGAVLRDGFLFLGDFERLDRDLYLAGLLVELDHPRIDLLADGEAFGALVVAVAGELGPLDEGGEVGADDLHLDAGFLHFQHFAGHDRTLLDVARLSERIAFELLDAKRDALLLDVHIEDDGLDHVALLVIVDDLLARSLPVEVGEVDHAVDVAFEAEEQAELGLVLDFAFDGRTDRELLDEDFPGVAHGLLETERDAALDGIHFQHLHFDFLRGRNDLAGMHVLLGPRHLRDVDQAFDAGLELDERAVVGDVGDAAVEAGIQRILRLDALPRIVQELLHAERDAVRLVVDLDDLDLHGLADGQHLGRVVDAAPGDIGDVQQAVDAAEVDERTVIGDVLDHAVDHLPLFEVLHQLLALLGAGLFQDRAAGDDDVAATAVHLEDLERLRVVHQRRDVADRTDVDLRARQEGHGA